VMDARSFCQKTSMSVEAVTYREILKSKFKCIHQIRSDTQLLITWVSMQLELVPCISFFFENPLTFILNTHPCFPFIGDNKFNRQSRCPCKNGPACNYCGFCLGCSCRCHTWFTMRTRLCNAADEDQLLQTVKCTAAVKTASKSIITEGVQTTGIFEVDESTKYLRDRLKDAGDDELLHEDKKDDTEVKEEDDEKLTIGDTKDKAQANEEDDKKLPNGIKKENVKENKNYDDKLTNDDKKDKTKAQEDDHERLPSGIKKENVKENKNYDDKLTNDDKKDKTKAQEDDHERLPSGIKKENVKENHRKKNRTANEDNG
jgi:hypothetical protein